MTSILCKLLAVLLCCLMLGSLAGCERETDPNEAIARANATNIQRLTNLYLAFQMKHDWLGPKNEKDFKSFLSSFSPNKLQRIGVAPGTTEELFVSDRDGAPFKIRFSVQGSAMGCSEPVVFESEGIGGKRMIGFLNMTHREVDEAEYEQLWLGQS